MSEGFTPITLMSLKDCFKDLPADAYLKLFEGKYVKAFEKTTGLDFARLAHYEAKGVTHFYISDADWPAMEKFLHHSPIMTLSRSDVPVESKRRAIWAVMEQTLFESFKLASLQELSIGKAFTALKSSLESDGEFIEIISRLLKVAPKSDLFFRHALSTAIYAYVIGMLSGQNSSRAMRIVLFSALFHDVGKLKLPENRRIASQNRSVAELEEFRTHPKLTIEMIMDPLPFADEEIRRCIVQHKERVDGKGYPYEVRSVAIYGLAKVLAIADAFSELTLGLEDGKPYTHVQAIAAMKRDSGHFEMKLLYPFAELILTRGLPKAA